MIESLYLFSIATLALALSPGPDNIYVITQSLVNGVKSGIVTTAGLISGCIVHTTLLAFGISLIIKNNPTLLFVIKCCGAAYLLYLAYKVYRSDASIFISDKAQKREYVSLYKQGVIMNLLNPKVMLFFLAFFPAFIWEGEMALPLKFYILGGVFMLVSFITFSLLAILAGKIKVFIQANQWVGFALKWLQIIVFVGIAIFIVIP